MLAAAEQAVVVHPSVPAKTLKELIALAKQKPGALNYASAGTGTAIHLGAELLKMRTGIDMTQVPTGAADLRPRRAGRRNAGDRRHRGIDHRLHPGGRLRAIASTGGETLAGCFPICRRSGSGYPGFEASVWFAMLAPARRRKRSWSDPPETIKALQHPTCRPRWRGRVWSPSRAHPRSSRRASGVKPRPGRQLIKKTGIRLE